MTLSHLDYFYGAFLFLFLFFLDLNIKRSAKNVLFLFHGTIFEWSIPLTLIFFCVETNDWWIMETWTNHCLYQFTHTKTALCGSVEVFIVLWRLFDNISLFNPLTVLNDSRTIWALCGCHGTRLQGARRHMLCASYGKTPSLCHTSFFIAENKKILQ